MSHPLFLLSPSWRFCSSKVGFLKLELTSMRRSAFNLTNRQTFHLYRICALHRTKRSLLLRPAHKCTSLRDLSFVDDTQSWIVIPENAGGEGRKPETPKNEDTMLQAPSDRHHRQHRQAIPGNGGKIAPRRRGGVGNANLAKMIHSPYLSTPWSCCCKKGSMTLRFIRTRR